MTEETKALVKARDKGMDAVVNKLFSTKTPSKFIKSRPGPGGKPVRYVEIGYVTNELNKAFGPFWEFRVVDKQIGKNQVWVQGQLTIKDPKTGFSVTKETFGGADIKINKTSGQPVDIANDLKSAVSDCTKKCASMFGIAADVFFKEQDLYDQMDTVIDVDDGEKESIRQIVMSKFFALAKQKGFDAERAKQRIKEIYNVEHMEQLTTEQMEKTIATLEVYYEDVADGEEPRKKNEGVRMLYGEKKPEAIPVDPPVTVVEQEEIKTYEEVSVETPKTYRCKGKVHDGQKEEDIPKVPVGEFCSKECQDSYYPPKREYKWEKKGNSTPSEDA